MCLSGQSYDLLCAFHFVEEILKLFFFGWIHHSNPPWCKSNSPPIGKALDTVKWRMTQNADKNRAYLSLRTNSSMAVAAMMGPITVNRAAALTVFFIESPPRYVRCVTITQLCSSLPSMQSNIRLHLGKVKNMPSWFWSKRCSQFWSGDDGKQTNVMLSEFGRKMFIAEMSNKIEC